jgi:hypothetical protein
MPSIVRMSRKAGHPRTTADSSVSSAAASSDMLMIGFRDQPSAAAPMISIDTARQAVVNDKARLLSAALM